MCTCTVVGTREHICPSVHMFYRRCAWVDHENLVADILPRSQSTADLSVICLCTTVMVVSLYSPLESLATIKYISSNYSILRLSPLSCVNVQFFLFWSLRTETGPNVIFSLFPGVLIKYAWLPGVLEQLQR